MESEGGREGRREGEFEKEKKRGTDEWRARLMDG